MLFELKTNKYWLFAVCVCSFRQAKPGNQLKFKNQKNQKKDHKFHDGNLNAPTPCNTDLHNVKCAHAWCVCANFLTSSSQEMIKKKKKVVRWKLIEKLMFVAAWVSGSISACIICGFCYCLLLLCSHTHFIISLDAIRLFRWLEHSSRLK